MATCKALKHPRKQQSILVVQLQMTTEDGVETFIWTDEVVTRAPPGAISSLLTSSSPFKGEDSYRSYAAHSFPRWVPVAGGITAPLAWQANKRSPRSKTFIAPTVSA